MRRLHCQFWMGRLKQEWRRCRDWNELWLSLLSPSMHYACGVYFDVLGTRSIKKFCSGSCTEFFDLPFVGSNNAASPACPHRLHTYSSMQKIGQLCG